MNSIDTFTLPQLRCRHAANLLRLRAAVAWRIRARERRGADTAGLAPPLALLLALERARATHAARCAACRREAAA